MLVKIKNNISIKLKFNEVITMFPYLSDNIINNTLIIGINIILIK